MFLFYTPEITPKTQRLVLPEEEGRHALRVLRKQVGDVLCLLDGRGGEYRAEISSTKGKRCEVLIRDYQHHPKNQQRTVHLAIAPTKNTDRIEWFVEKSVEIGVQKISFLLTQHSERKVLKLERIRKIAISAMKQSGDYYLPELEGLTKLEDFLTGQCVDPSAEKFVAYVPADASQTLHASYQKGNVCLLIGPEGGFAPTEVERAAKEGFKAVSLGNKRLRTETAGVVACTLLNLP